MAGATKSKELVVEAVNHIGLLSEMGGTLAKAKVNLKSICCYCMGSQATFMFMVDRHATAKKALRKAGYKVSDRPIILVELSNRPGELSRAAAKVSAVGVDIDYVYATAASRTVTAVFKTRNDTKALKALKR